MRLIKIHIKNFRSIVDSGEVRIEPLQAFVGENNTGKSNLLHAIEVFLTPGAAGIQEEDFSDAAKPIVITSTFGELKPDERKRLRKYLLGDKLILEKHIQLQEDKKSGKIRPNTEYHGYIARPKEWWLSIEGVVQHEQTERPDWHRVAKDHGILEYVTDTPGKVNKGSYENGLERLMVEREDIEFEEPKLGQTQAFGLQPVLLDFLPVFHILPAITDYSDEVDRRSTSTNFRRLMGDLADRILRFDARYQEIESSIRALTNLLNAPQASESRPQGQERLAILETVEQKLKEIICQLMPSVCGVRVNVTVEGVKDVFSKGVSIQIDDGKMTDVLMKGHGLQRCVVFGLLQALILNQRGELISIPEEKLAEAYKAGRTIILAIEEPELYIHPQMQRLIYSVLKTFATTDQVIYSTHAPAFVDLANYESVAVVRKESVDTGTTICQCDPGVFDDVDERKAFQFIASFGLEQNQMFFAKKVILVEGSEDVIAILATGRAENLFSEFPEKLGFTLIDIESKGEMKKFMKLLNAFHIPFVVLHELDGNPNHQDNKDIRALLGSNRSVELPHKLENALGLSRHFKDKYDAKMFCERAENITEEFRKIVRDLFSS